MTTRVTFKHETSFDGEPAGQLTVYDVELYEADPVLVERRELGLPGMPYGYAPQGMESKGWVLLSVAREFAAQHGVELEIT